MADQPKSKKTRGTQNDDRPNKKAAKKGAVHHTKVHLTHLQKTLLGGGGMAFAKRMDRRVRIEHPERRNKKDESAA